MRLLFSTYLAPIPGHRSRDPGLHPGGRYALIKAAWSGCVENLEVLLEHGADPEVRDTWGQTALGVAERFSRRAAAAFLCSRKA